MRRRVLGLLALTAAIALAAGCTAGPSTRPPVAIRGLEAPVRRAPPPPPPNPVTLPQPGRYDPDSLPWRECTASFDAVLRAAPPRIECTQVRVAADLGRPGLSGSLELDLTRIGSGPAPLVVLGDTGGPPGTVLAARLATRLPPALLDSYTLIGFASRGTGPSNPLTCIPRPARERILGADPAATRPTQLGALADTARTATRTCLRRVGQLLVSIGSSATADDLEQLRVALDAPVLNVLARGRASTAVLRFMSRYPASVGRVVLDGVPDPALDAVAHARARARAAQRGLNRILAGCTGDGCPLGPHPRAAFDRLIRALRADPLRTSTIRVTPGVAYHAVLAALGDPQREARLVTALAQARGGDGSGLAGLVGPLIDGVAGRPPRFDAALAARCNSTETRISPGRAGQLAARWSRHVGGFGGLFAQRLLLCGTWPVTANVPPGRGWRDLAPVLVIATENDPITPARGTRQAARRLPSAVLVNWQGHAHGAVGRSACVDELVTSYLVEGRVPTPSTLCPP